MFLRTEELSLPSLLNNLTVVFPPHGLVGLVGPNGAGKSTLLRCLSGEHPPKSGRVWLEERPLSHWRAREVSQKLAHLPQMTSFPFAYTVEEHVLLGAKSERDAQEALSTMELTTLKSHSLLELSGGERQRAAIARTLAQNTPVLLLDEPLTHLDLYHQQRLLSELSRRKELGHLVVIALHDLRLARKYCSHVVVLSAGNLVGEGTPEDALTEQCLQSVFRVSLAELD
jgi:ferric citrate transport system ATP-binding protein